MRTIDVAVVGVGAMGSAALWRLSARGVAAVGFEQFVPGHDRGSSHGESRIIRTAYQEGAQYVPLVQAAFELWRLLERESGARLLTMTGALMIGQRAGAVITGTLASAEAHGLAHEVLDAAALSRRYPQHCLAPGEVAIYEPEAGFLRPEAAVRAMAERARALGATILRETPVERITPRPDGVEIAAGGEVYRARHAVVAAGAWMGALLPGLRLPLQVERQVMPWFPALDGDLFAPERFPVFVYEGPGGAWRYGFPSLDGTTVKIAAHHGGTITTAEVLDRSVTREDLAPIEEFVATHVRGLRPTAARAEVCMYTNTPDEAFLVGSAPGLPSVTLVGGCSGHSFKFATVLGDAAADLATRGTTRHAIDFCVPQRFVGTAAPPT